MADEPQVLISAARLAELEALEAKVSARNEQKLIALKKYNKEHPEKTAERVRRFKELNRDAYNARRRELYHLKKAGGGQQGSSCPTNSPGVE